MTAPPKIMGFEQQHNLDAHSAIAQAIGAASLCWDSAPSGMFREDLALAIATELAAHLDSLQVQRAEPKPVPVWPKGGVEQARRNLMRDDPRLYAYIEAHVAAREVSKAGDDASGAADGHGAANRVWRLAARWTERRRQLMERE